MSEIDNIKQMIMRASPNVAAGLMARLEILRETDGDSIPIDELIDLAREKTANFEGQIDRSPKISRQFFAPFESMFENIIKGRETLPGSFPRNSLKFIWHVVSHRISSQYCDEISKSVKAAAIAQDYSKIDQFAVQIRKQVFEFIEQSENPRILNVLDSRIEISAALRFANLLIIEDAANQRGIELNIDISAVPSTEFNEFVVFFQYLDKIDQGLAVDFLLCLMGNSAKPWEILRILHVAFLNTNDVKLAPTAYNIIGERLLAILERKLLFLANDLRMPIFDGAKVAHNIEEFNKLSMGIERSNLLDKQFGPWAKKLQNIRAQGSEIFNQACNSSTKVIFAAFPLEKGRLKGVGAVEIPRCYTIPNKERIALAIEYAIFLRDSRLYAPNAGFGGARDAAQKDVLRYCDHIKAGLIAIKDHPERGNYFNEWSQMAVKLVEIIEDVAAAKSLERRIGLMRVN